MSNDVMKAAFKKAGLAEQVRRVEEKERWEAAEEKRDRIIRDAEQFKMSRDRSFLEAMAECVVRPSGQDDAMVVVNSLTVEDMNMDLIRKMFLVILPEPFFGKVVSALYHKVISLSNMPPPMKGKVSRSFYSLNWEVDLSDKSASDHLVALILLKSVVTSLLAFSYDKFFSIKTSLDQHGMFALKQSFSGQRVAAFSQTLSGELIFNSSRIVDNSLKMLREYISGSIDSDD